MRILRLCLLLIFLPTLAPASQLSIFAASSLTQVLRDVTQAYQTQHPAEEIVLHFAGSQTLATQIEQGAPADLFIAADTSTMERLLKHGLVENPRPLLYNRLVLAIQPELKGQVAALKDIARDDLILVIGNPQVPVGKYTRQLLTSLAADPAYGAEWVNKITQNIVSEENMVKAIVTKLLLGEVDAGIVYQSDLTADSTQDLLAIALPKQHNPLATYPVAQTTDSRIASDNFLTFLFSPAAQQLFAQHGFVTAGGE